MRRGPSTRMVIAMDHEKMDAGVEALMRAQNEKARCGPARAAAGSEVKGQESGATGPLLEAAAGAEAGTEPESALRAHATRGELINRGRGAEAVAPELGGATGLLLEAAVGEKVTKKRAASTLRQRRAHKSGTRARWGYWAIAGSRSGQGSAGVGAEPKSPLRARAGSGEPENWGGGAGVVLTEGNEIAGPLLEVRAGGEALTI
ncbi:hypothetical protein B0H19DRAFT_1236352 [Mycena capillaripes]|nr:hypothetical protein B0H19DRAFT_1236352 [Mycena capillaripes]